MRILHTADWHIGHFFYGYNRRQEHLYFFNWLKQTVKERRIDVLMIAGDVFDSPNPSADSQKIYYRFLREITHENPALQIVIIAGNHDSAARLEAPNPLFEEMNIIVKGTIRKNEDGEIDYKQLLIPLKINDEQKAWCIAVPYLRQGDYPDADTYSAGVAEMYNRLNDVLKTINTQSLPVVVMGHLQSAGATVLSDDRSERSIVGGLECISPDVFSKEEFTYTALGHLHRHQWVNDLWQVQYAGSPLPVSFSEINYNQGVNLIELRNGKSCFVRRIDFTPPIKLLSIPEEAQPLKNVLDEITKLPDGDITFNSPYLELKVLITEPEPSMRNQIEEALKNKSVRLASAIPFRVKQGADGRKITYEEMKAINPLDIAEDVFRKQYGSDMPDNMKSLLQSVIQEVGK